MPKKFLLFALFVAVLFALNFYFFARKDKISQPQNQLFSSKTLYNASKKSSRNSAISEPCISKECVSEYVIAHGKLPQNFITKREANAIGWSGGDLWLYAHGKSIGGDKFGNFERTLPAQKGRIYKEADIDYRGGARGAKRLVFSNDGLIFYTKDHYNSFERIK